MATPPKKKVSQANIENISMRETIHRSAAAEQGTQFSHGHQSNNTHSYSKQLDQQAHGRIHGTSSTQQQKLNQIISRKIPLLGNASNIWRAT
jgi:hypothetical protein